MYSSKREMTQNLISKSTFGVVDLGSAALRFDLYQIPDNKLKIINLINNTRYLLRLGNRDGNTEINTKKVENTQNACKEIRKILDQYANVKFSSVATESLRAAINGNLISQSCSEILKTDLNIISPSEEARLTSLGICFFEKMDSLNLKLGEEVLFIDIGGGSTEISKHIYVNKNNLSLETSISTNVGVLEGGSDPEAILELIKKLNIKKNSKIIGSSGTFRSILEIHKNLKKLNPNLNYLSSEDIEEIIYLSKKLTKEEYIIFTEPAANRRDLLPKGFEIVRLLLNEINPHNIYVSKFSLRHGLLAEMIMSEYDHQAKQITNSGWEICN